MIHGRIFGIAALALLVGTICAAESGRVVDEMTMQPIPGAFVFATWTADAANPVISVTRCYQFAITRTDGDERFDLQTLSWNVEPWLINRRRWVAAYSPGYVMTPKRQTDPSIISMRPFAGTTLERLEQLTKLSRSECVYDSDGSKVVPFYRAMHAEAQSLAKSKVEQSHVLGLRDSIEIALVGTDEFYKRLSRGDYTK